MGPGCPFGQGAGWRPAHSGPVACTSPIQGTGCAWSPAPPPLPGATRASALRSLTPPCPTAIFCDYYNPPHECEWHYEPCGNRSFETCRTVNGIHSNISVSYLEGESEGPRSSCGAGDPKFQGGAMLALLQDVFIQQRPVDPELGPCP